VGDLLRASVTSQLSSGLASTASSRLETSRRSRVCGSQSPARCTRGRPQLSPFVAIGLVFASLLTLHGSPEGQRVWFKFNKAFINANYASGEALGTVHAQTWDAAGTVYPTKCGGSDGELHVGSKDAGLDLPNSQSPLSGKAFDDNADWGIVFELPDAKAGNGPVTLTKNVGKTLTFNGYFRVWNEGHWKGPVHSSNPHHVFEVHPAWRLTFQGGSFDEPSLTRTMTGYRGFGLSKYEKVLDEAGDWLKAYQDDLRPEP
jgi:hypothetical protein